MKPDASEIAWNDGSNANGGAGRNVLADDIVIDVDAAHPERFREMWDADPRKSIAQPGGAMFTYLLYGSPAIRRERGDSE